MSPLFCDHAVLQREMPVPVWGTSDPAATVVVSFAGHRAEATADANGRWKATLPVLNASAHPSEMTVQSGESTLVIRDILVGDLWLCSGQSNMSFALNRANDAEREISSAAHPLIRLFDVPRVPAESPRRTVNAKWTACTPETVKMFSAVAYFFGRDLSEVLKVPIGLIHSGYGGTVAQNWVPRSVLEDPRFNKVLELDRERVAKLPEAMAAYRKALNDWETSSPERRAATSRPNEPAGIAHKGGPAHLYNGMIAPLVPYAVRGVLWYQGESNRRDSAHYRQLLPELINGWRREWKQPRLPFIIVQIANYMPPEGEPKQRSIWAEIREVQRQVSLTVDDAPLVVTIDLGDSKDLHPKNKQDVGKRAALQAMSKVYGQSITADGPILDSFEINGDTVELSFKSAGKLELRGEGQFTVAGSDRVFHPAVAKIENRRIIVKSDRVTQPLAVRYAWSADPRATLYNSDGLPASPFRTDDWPFTGPILIGAPRQ